MTGTEPLEVCGDLLVRARTLRNSAKALAGRQRAWTRSGARLQLPKTGLSAHQYGAADAR
ncbi:hypothetical protein [Streptomyces sp. NPDC017964]|uniref:hypothetical protein n=1 Tax=Streptomyces sp. NPDC017964 TaxID=3365022 RepID=UPI0037B55708